MVGSPSPAAWTAVQEVLRPIAGIDAALLYVMGADTGEAEPTPTGERHTVTVTPRTTASFGTYFNAFPAAEWAARTPAGAVRLELHVDGPATVRMLRSDADGVVTAVGEATDGRIELPLGSPDGGLVWFEVEAGDSPVHVAGGTWSVDAPPLRDGALVLGMPTVDRQPFVAANLRRLRSAPALLEHVVRILVVDQGERSVAADPAVVAEAERLGPRLRVLRQPNLGGAGGYSRIMQEAVGEASAAFVVLLDDDIAIEPASLLRAHAFARSTSVPTIVGGQQLDLDAPTTVQAAAERVTAGTFWWTPADARTSDHDYGELPLADAPWLHRRREADYNGWWMCLMPLEVVRGIGYALPLFLKWDDAEYGLRAAAAGAPTVSLPGAAVWHVAFRSKDDSIEWAALFHARNRIVSAMLHHGRASRVAGHSLALDVKQLLAMQYPAARLRHAGIRLALAGPAALERRDLLGVARGIAAADPALPRRDPAEAAGARPARADRPAPDGAALAPWAVRTALRQLLTPMREAPARLPQARWWLLARHGRVYAPTADGRAVLLFVLDRRALVAGLAEAILLHALLVVAWPVLRLRYGRAARRLANPAAWARRFE